MHSSFSTRLKNYPFNLTAQVQFVSFKSTTDTTNPEAKITDSLPRQNDTICYSKLVEIKTLTLLQIDQLTDIIYNYGYPKSNSKKPYIATFTLCYNPRNAILFLDKNGKVFEFIEICFECNRTKESSEKISLGEMCNQKITMLKSFFKKTGIEYGITKGLITDNN